MSSQPTDDLTVQTSNLSLESQTQNNNTEEDQKQSNNDPQLEEEDEDALELNLLKKKKKKKKKVEESAEAEPTSATNGIQDGEKDYNYLEMLQRVYVLLHDLNPNLTSRKRHIMPPPQLSRVGTRKTMWTNYAVICETMHRTLEHVQQFLFAELGTDGSIDGSKRLIIKGRYQPKQIESLLKKYITEYVTCHMCKNPETSLTRDSVTRLYFLQCESCGSRRSVAPIKTGFHATMRTDRKRVKEAA